MKTKHPKYPTCPAHPMQPMIRNSVSGFCELSYIPEKIKDEIWEAMEKLK